MALLLLADGRTPVGASFHSFGLESAAAAGDVVDAPGLAAFAEARMVTAGFVDACFAAGVCARLQGSGDALAALVEAHDEYGARILSPALAARCRDLGRYLLRLGAAAWPAPVLATAAAGRPEGWYQPVVLGLVAASAGLGPADAATCAIYGLGTGIASAGIRLLGLDPVAVHASLARLAPVGDALATEAAASARSPFARLPSWSWPLAEIRAEQHAGAHTPRLFAS